MLTCVQVTVGGATTGIAHSCAFTAKNKASQEVASVLCYVASHCICTNQPGFLTH